MNNEEVSRRSQRPHKDRGGRGRGSILKRIFLWALSLFVLAFVALAALFFYYASSAPTITENDLKSQTTTTIYDANNKVISRLGAQKREYASNSEIPTLLKHGVVAIEDRRFYQATGWTRSGSWKRRSTTSYTVRTGCKGGPRLPSS